MKRLVQKQVGALQTVPWMDAVNVLKFYVVVHDASSAVDAQRYVALLDTSLKVELTVQCNRAAGPGQADIWQPLDPPTDQLQGNAISTTAITRHIDTSIYTLTSPSRDIR